MRRIFLTIFLTALVAQEFVSAQQDIEITLRQPLVGPDGSNILATQVVVTIQPGGSGSPPHFHSGPSIGFIIEGELLFQVVGKPPRIIHAGEGFYEVDRAIHIWGANASNSTVCKLTATTYGRPNENFITLLEEYIRPQTREEAIAEARRGHEATPHLTVPSASKLKIKQKYQNTHKYQNTVSE